MRRPFKVVKKDKFHFYIKKKTIEYTINSFGFFQKQTSWPPRVKRINEFCGFLSLEFVTLGLL